MKKICWFSCGITSAVACKMAIDLYGEENCDLVYIDIATAHPDNKRFIFDCEEWFGMRIKTIKSDKFNDQFEVIEKIRYINGAHGAPCTLNLKKNVRIQYEQSNTYSGQVFGFEFELKEINRAIRFSEQYPHTKPLFPLIDRKMTKNECAYIVRKAGIELPEMYRIGFNNNNCIGCVKGGAGYWNMIKKHFRPEFDRMSELEQSIGASCLNGKYLKDLRPKDGRHVSDTIPDCGLFCEIEFADLIDPRAEKILQGELRI